MRNWTHEIQQHFLVPHFMVNCGARVEDSRGWEFGVRGFEYKEHLWRYWECTSGSFTVEERIASLTLSDRSSTAPSATPPPCNDVGFQGSGAAGIRVKRGQCRGGGMYSRVPLRKTLLHRVCRNDANRFPAALLQEHPPGDCGERRRLTRPWHSREDKEIPRRFLCRASKAGQVHDRLVQALPPFGEDEARVLLRRTAQSIVGEAGHLAVPHHAVVEKVPVLVDPRQRVGNGVDALVPQRAVYGRLLLHPCRAVLHVVIDEVAAAASLSATFTFPVNCA